MSGTVKFSEIRRPMTPERRARIDAIKDEMVAAEQAFRPRRIQRKRTKGWRMPEGAVYVGRPTRWGNDIRPGMLDLHSRPLGVERATELYRLAALRFVDEAEPQWVEDWIAPLRGRDLACWCPLGKPCHADVLLELANAPSTSGTRGEGT